MEAVSRWHRSLRERRVRSLEVALPARAEFEGGWTTPEEGLAAYWRCLRQPPTALHERAMSLLYVIRRSSSRTLTLTSARGGSFEVEIDPDQPHVSDGVIDADDLAHGRTAEVLPAGSIAFLPREESGDGVLHCEYAFALGRHFRDLTIIVRRGRILSMEGGEGVDDLWNRIRSSTGEPDRVAEIRFGLNPGGTGLTGKFILDACLAGNVTVTFGNNELLGGRVRSTLDLWLPSRSTTVRAGDVSVVP
jgi:hypothetical protein